MIYPIARLPDKWVEQAQAEGAHVDFTLKSPWQLFADFDGDTIHGFIGLLLTSENSATIRGWYVFPEHRGKGFGSELLSHAIRWANESGRDKLEIRTAHDVEWVGFEWTGYERKGGNHERHYAMKLGTLFVLG